MNRDPENRTTVINTGKGSNGAGWFIAGGLAVILLVGLWLVSGGVFDRSTTGSIDVPNEVRIEVPDVDVEIAPVEAEPADAARE